MIPDSLLITALVVLVLVWCGISERRKAAMDLGWEGEDEPTVIDAKPSGLRFERRFNEEGAEWHAMEEEYALAVLRSSFFDVPKTIQSMKAGETFRTRFAEYRLAQEPA